MSRETEQPRSDYAELILSLTSHPLAAAQSPVDATVLWCQLAHHGHNAIDGAFALPTLHDQSAAIMV